MTFKLRATTHLMIMMAVSISTSPFEHLSTISKFISRLRRRSTKDMPKQESQESVSTETRAPLTPHHFLSSCRNIRQLSRILVGRPSLFLKHLPSLIKPAMCQHQEYIHFKKPMRASLQPAKYSSICLQKKRGNGNTGSARKKAGLVLQVKRSSSLYAHLSTALRSCASPRNYTGTLWARISKILSVE